MNGLKKILKAVLPRSIVVVICFFYPLQNVKAIYAFLLSQGMNIGFFEKAKVLRQIFCTSLHVESPHTTEEMVTFISYILRIPKEKKGVIVEAGCFKGSSSAKFSIAAAITGRQLVIFDSFKGIPANDEPHDKNIFGGDATFGTGDYCGSIQEVKVNIDRFGKIDSCRFIEGFFQDTMPYFNEPICAAYIDVDLASSTCTCLKYLFPLLEDQSSLFSQDGHLPLVIDVLNDEVFWSSEVGATKPRINGLRKKKLVEIKKT